MFALQVWKGFNVVVIVTREKDTVLQCNRQHIQRKAEKKNSKQNIIAYCSQLQIHQLN